MHIISILFAVCSFLFVMASEAQSDLQRRQISVDNTGNPDTLVDYQILIRLTPEQFDYAHSTSDGRDVRVYCPGAEGYLPYWIEQWIPYGESLIHARVPDIPARGDLWLYLEYGDSSRVPESNGDAVFDFFDEFSGTTLDPAKWDIVQNHGTIEVTGGYLRLYRPGDVNPILIASDATLTGFKVIEYRQRIMRVMGQYYYSCVGYGLLDAGGGASSIGYAGLYKSSPSQEPKYESAISYRLCCCPGRTTSHADTNGFEITPPPSFAWFKEVFVMAPGHLERTMNDQLSESTTRYTGVSVGKIYVTGQSPSVDWGGYSEEHHTDYLLVRKYSAFEPIVTLGEVVVGIPKGEGGPEVISLSAHPNPCSGGATVTYVISQSADVAIRIFDVSGRQVTTLVQEARPSGVNTVRWDGSAADGRRVASGVYFVRLECAGTQHTQRIVLLR